MSVLTQTIIVGLLVTDFSLLFFVISLGFKFYQHRNILIFKKRQSHLTILMGVLIAIQLLERLLVLIDIIYEDANDGKSIPVYHTIVEVLQWTIDPFLSQGVLYLLLLKFYLIYYEINWTLSSLRLKWVLHINPGVGKQDYFLLYKKTKGNAAYVAKRYIGFYLVSSLTSAILFSLA